jgi:iron complex outermembrane recepter protein
MALLSLAAAGAPSAALADTPQDTITDTEDLTRLSIEELMNLEVSTVSRRPERRWSVPSGLDVVTGEDIRRAGVRNLPDALRLAAGVHVAQPSARSWAVSVRGMNVLAANKINVVMDGRSLFTPFFSGVQWDAQDTLLDDVDRIEVVRGPVGALWGAFAVNGLIQILTKPASATQGWMLSAATGTEDPGAFAVRHGGTLGADRYYRAYGKYYQTDWTYNAAGEHAQPATDFLQAGFRLDDQGSPDSTWTLQGDYYTNQGLPLDRVQAQIDGANVLGRWRRQLGEGSELQLEGYFDHTYRLLPLNFEESRDTGSASARYRRDVGRHGLLLGADALVSGDTIGNIGVALLEPGQRTTHAVGLYVQDTLQITPQASMVLGVKADHNSFSGYEVQPTVRVAWTPAPATAVWAAVSRAVRTPVRIDEDLVIRFSGLTLFEANDAFQTEAALAYEAGARHRVASSLTLDASVFAYRYHDLRSTEPSGPATIPTTFKNGLEARSHGAELAAMYQPTDKFFFKGSYRFLDLEFTTAPGSRHTTGGRAEGNDPRHVAVLAAHVSLPWTLELDGFLRTASSLPAPALDGYTAVDARLGWRPTKGWEVSLSGRNLLRPQHAEFVTTNSLNEHVHRRVTLQLTWRH